MLSCLPGMFYFVAYSLYNVAITLVVVYLWFSLPIYTSSSLVVYHGTSIMFCWCTMAQKRKYSCINAPFKKKLYTDPNVAKCEINQLGAILVAGVLVVCWFMWDVVGWRRLAVKMPRVNSLIRMDAKGQLLFFYAAYTMACVGLWMVVEYCLVRDDDWGMSVGYSFADVWVLFFSYRPSHVAVVIIPDHILLLTAMSCVVDYHVYPHLTRHSSCRQCHIAAVIMSVHSLLFSGHALRWWLSCLSTTFFLQATPCGVGQPSSYSLSHVV